MEVREGGTCIQRNNDKSAPMPLSKLRCLSTTHTMLATRNYITHCGWPAHSRDCTVNVRAADQNTVEVYIRVARVLR